MSSILLFSQQVRTENKFFTTLDKVEKDTTFQQGHFAFSLRNAKTGKILAEKNADKLLQVASCLKLFSTATALEILGKDFTFQTHLAYDGKIETGTLQGNLYIVGGGDPTLGSSDWAGKMNAQALLEHWANLIIKQGIQKINGSVIAYDGYFGEYTLPRGWIWEDIGNYYGSNVYGLNLNDNEYILYLQANKKIGQAAQILRTEPELPFLQFEGKILTAPKGTGDNAYIFGSPKENTRFLEGTIPQEENFAIKGALPNPPLSTAYLLHQTLQKKGIALSQEPKVIKKTTNWKIIDTYHSPTLAQIIEQTNTYSINLYAEALYRQINRDKPTNLLEFWQGKGLKIDEKNIEDGSGLSHKNHVSAHHLTQLLHEMFNSTHYKAFETSLPVAAHSGTMLNWGKNSILQGNIRAKTGSMSGVVALSGYCKTMSGEILCFSIVANQYKGKYSHVRQLFEKILVELVSSKF
ncbi:MAG: D-alanyl-D-alanine carboxypeptidase/D-alanyl-D-alanine-endopeptidase [Raineya sp.]